MADAAKTDARVRVFARLRPAKQDEEHLERERESVGNRHSFQPTSQATRY